MLLNVAQLRPNSNLSFFKKNEIPPKLARVCWNLREFEGGQGRALQETVAMIGDTCKFPSLLTAGRKENKPVSSLVFSGASVTENSLLRRHN